MHGEALAITAQTLGMPLGDAAGLLAPLQTQAPRDPLLFPASRWTLGSPDDGFVFDNERAPHQVQVPEFEIDAQAVSWSQYCEFVEDGGYDEARWWSADGWAWVQREGRRTPRHVDADAPGVLQQRFGQHRARADGAAGRSCQRSTRRRPGATGPAGACRAKSNGNWRPTRARRAASAGAMSGNGRRRSFRPYPGFEAASVP